MDNYANSHNLINIKATTLHKAFRNNNSLAKYIMCKPIKARFYCLEIHGKTIYIGISPTLLPLVISKKYYKIDKYSGILMSNVLVI